MDWKRFFTIVGVILLVWFIISQPAQAANLSKGILDSLKTGATSLLTFVKSVFA